VVGLGNRVMSPTSTNRRAAPEGSMPCRSIRPAAHFIDGALTEVSHHDAQIGALRDLYAWRQIDRR
jgi:hypothetical protein